MACDLVNVNNLQNKVAIINLYAPNADDPSFFDEVNRIIVDSQSHKLVTGDFNLTLNAAIDRHNSVERNPKVAQKLQSIMQAWSLIDLWRVRNPDKRMYTWDKTGPQYIASRIDNMLISEGLTTLCDNITHLSGIRTDHSALFCAINFDQQSRGPSYWKLNCSLLNNKNYLDQVKELLINKMNEYEHLQCAEAWELIKTKSS